MVGAGRGREGKREREMENLCYEKHHELRLKGTDTVQNEKNSWYPQSFAHRKNTKKATQLQTRTI